MKETWAKEKKTECKIETKSKWENTKDIHDEIHNERKINKEKSGKMKE
jgi:hypothetical protein